MIQYGSRADTGEAFLEEAKRLASGYGAMCCQAGLSVSETVKTFLFFGHSMINTVQQAGHLEAEVALNASHRVIDHVDPEEDRQRGQARRQSRLAPRPAPEPGDQARRPRL